MTFSPISIGIFFAAVGCFFFTLFDATTKTLVSRYPVFEVVSITFFLSVPFVLLYAKITEGPRFIEAITLHKKGLHLARGVAQFVSNVLMAYSFMHLSLAEFYVILFLAPLAVALLAWPVLKEKPPLSLAAVMLVSFAGVVIALRPDQVALSLWAWLAFAGTMTNAVLTIILRKMAATETAISPAYSAGIVVAIFSGIVAAFNFVMPAVNDLWLFVLAGIVYAFGQIFFVRAFKYAPAPYAASAQFLQLVYGAFVGFLVFGDVPSVWIYIGGGIVIAANLFLVWSQNRTKQPS